MLLSLKPVQGLREVAAVASEADAAWPAAASPDTQRRDRALYAASAAMLAESRAAAPETQLPDPRKGNAALRWSVVIALGRRGAAPPTSHRSHDGLCLRAWDVWYGGSGGMAEPCAATVAVAWVNIRVQGGAHQPVSVSAELQGDISTLPMHLAATHICGAPLKS